MIPLKATVPKCFLGMKKILLFPSPHLRKGVP
jgi:hypothetical protein